MITEKELYDLLTDNKHLTAVKHPDDHNLMIGRADLEIYYWIQAKENERKENID